MAGKLPSAGANLELNTAAWDSAFKDAMSDAAKLDALAPTVKINVNDSEIGTAIDLAANLDASTSLKVNVDSTELETASDKLDTLTTIGAIDLAISVSGTAVSFFEGLGRFSGVAGLMEMDTALAAIEGRTGRMIPGAEKLITDLYTNGWGESRTQIADTIIEAGKLQIANEDLAEATEAAFHVQAVTGGETNEILRSMDTLVKNDLVPSYTAAADLITVGFQTGNDRGQDMLDTFNEYGSTFKQVGISGQGALGFINSGLVAGIDNSDRIADAIRETGIRLGEIGTDENIAAAFEQLDALSDIDLAKSLDAKNAGEISGDEFYAGFFEALADANEADPQAAQTIAATLVGTIAEDFGIESVSQLTPIWDETMGSFEGRAETAGNTISDTLGVTVDTFLRNIEQMATSFLSSDAIDLDGKIETFKTQLQTAMATAMEGGSIGEVFEAGFGITGIDTALANIGRVFGQFTITLLEIVAAIQDPLGINDADKATRGQITTMATAQLPFDLSVANPEEFDAIFKQAAQRGVSSADLGAALNTALDASVASGDFERTKAILAEILADPDVDPAAAQTLVDKYNTAIDTAMAAQAPPADANAWWERLKPPDSMEGAKAFTGPEGAGAKGTNWWETIEVSPETIESLNTADEAVVQLDTDIDSAMTNATLSTGLASQSMIDAFSAITDGVTTADEQIAMAITGNTMTASFDAMSVSAAANAEATKASFMGILATVSLVDSRMADFFYGVMAKVGAATAAIEGIGTVPSGAGGGGGVTNVNNVNVNQTNNVQSNAQAAAAGYQIGAVVRGVG